MPSPYSWRYSVRRPYYSRCPSTRNHTGLLRHPMSHTFVRDPGERPLRLFFIGDIMAMHGDRVPRLDPAVAELLRDADQVIGNCEAPVIRRPLEPAARRSLVFNMAEGYLQGIVEQLGVPMERLALSMANDHAGDEGVTGWASTQESLQRLGITPLGLCGREASPVVCVKRRGFNLGLMAWTHWMSVDVFRNQPGVCRTEHINALDLAELRERHDVDFLVGFPHWEYEFQHFPRDETRRLAWSLSRRGVDLIAGAHPHVPQPMEWIGSTLCAYSLGNFCGLGSALSTKLVSVLEVRVCTRGANRGRIAGYRLHPFVQVDEGKESAIVPLRKAPHDQHEQLRDRLGLVFEGAPVWLPPSERELAA